MYRSNPKRYSRNIAKAQADEKERAAALSARPSRVSMQCTDPSNIDAELDSVSAAADGADGGRSGRRICGCVPASAESAGAFQQMMDLSLLRDSIFIMFAVSNFLTSIGFNVPYVYTVVSTQRKFI